MSCSSLRGSIAVVLMLAALLFCRRASAQSAADQVYVGGTLVGNARLDDRSGSRWTQGGEVLLAPPSFVIGERDRLSLRLSYRYTGIELQGAAVIGDEPKRWNLHALSPSLTWSHILGRRWILSLGAGPSMASDLGSSLSFDDIQISGVGVLTHLVGGNPNFRVSVGLVAQSRSFLSPVLPFVTFDYRNPYVALSAGLSGLHVLGLVGDSAELGVFGSFSGGQYHVRSGTDDARIARARFLSLIDIGVGPEVNLRIAGPVWLEMKGGYNLLQSGRFNDANLDKVPGISLDSSGAFFGQLGIGVR